MKKIQIQIRVLMFILCMSFSWVSLALHPIKISTSIITQTNGEVSIKLYFFADDFGAHLQKLYVEDIDLEKSTSQTINSVIDYIKKHYVLKINNQKLELDALDNSFKDNVFQIGFKSKQNIKYIFGNTDIQLKNTLLFEAFKDQSNIVRIDFKGDGNYETLEFDKTSKIQKIKM